MFVEICFNEIVFYSFIILKQCNLNMFRNYAIKIKINLNNSAGHRFSELRRFSMAYHELSMTLLWWLLHNFNNKDK